MKYKIHPLCAGMRKLTDSETESLRASIVATGGASDPVKIWKGQLVDGFNRVTICEELGLPYSNKDMTDQLADEEAVERWILQNQLGRRNNTEVETMQLLGRLHRLADSKAGRPKAAAASEGSKAKKIAAQTGLSESTVQRADVFVEEFDHMSPEEKDKVRSGETPIGAVVQAGRERRKAAKPKPEPKQEPGKDEVTAFIESQSRRYSAALNPFKTKIMEIGQAAMGNGENPVMLRLFKEHAEDFCKKAALALDELADVYICKACFAVGCDECNNSGYVDVDTLAYQMRMINEDMSFAGKNAPAAQTEPEPEPEPEQKPEPPVPKALPLTCQIVCGDRKFIAEVAAQNAPTMNWTNAVGDPDEGTIVFVNKHGEATEPVPAKFRDIGAAPEVKTENPIEAAPTENLPTTSEVAASPTDNSEVALFIEDLHTRDGLPTEPLPFERPVDAKMEEALQRHPVPPGEEEIELRPRDDENTDTVVEYDMSDIEALFDE